MINILCRHLYIFILLVVFLIPNFAIATNNEKPVGFSIEPAVSHISVNNDTVFKSGFSFKNQSNESITFSVKVRDFEQFDNYGGVKIIENNSDKYDPIFASGWFSVQSEKITLPPKQKILIPYSVSVPYDAGPGGRSVVFIIESLSGNVHSRINMLVFLTVPGDAKENMEYKNFIFSPTISSSANGLIHLELLNSGKTHIRPEGTITIRNMFGAKRGQYDLSGDNSIGIIVPGAKKSIDYSWQGEMGLFDFGLWNARIELKYGVNNEKVSMNKLFFGVLPWKAVLITLIILFSSLFFFISSVKKLRREIINSNEKDIENIEKKVSAKFLLAFIISLFILILVVCVTLYSVLGYKGGGRFEKIHINKTVQ